MDHSPHKFNFAYTNPTPDLVVMRRGRHGAWNEYVQFKPYNSSLIFVAQLCGDQGTNVFEVAPGPKGTVRTLSVSHSAPIYAIEEVYQHALAVAQKRR